MSGSLTNTVKWCDLPQGGVCHAVQRLTTRIGIIDFATLLKASCEGTNWHRKERKRSTNVVRYNRDAVDARAVQEAEAIQRMQSHRLRMLPGQVTRRELRAGLEQLEGRRQFATLFKNN